MTKLRDQMKMELELKGYSDKTQSSYINHVKRYAGFFNKSPDKLATDEIKKYLHYLICEKKVSKSYVNSAYSALKFFYETTLKIQWDMKEIPRVKKSKKLPVVLSKDEVKSIFSATTNIKYKTIFMTIYAAGLRISEAASLKVEDIDSKNMQIRVREGKGNKDRYTILSKENLDVLRNYCKSSRITTGWLFPGSPSSKSISTRSIQRVFKEAVYRARIKKNATVHTLRHCFATHLLESGIGIYYIQRLLGHSNPKTTSVYIHLTRYDVLNIKSPLDLMEGN